MNTSDVVLLVAILVLLVLAGFLSMGETGLTRLNRVRVQALEDEGHDTRSLRRLVDDPDRWLTPLLLVVLACHLVLATLFGILAEHHFGAAGVAIGTLFEVVIVFVFAEAGPKTFALQHTTRASQITAPVVGFLTRFPPLRWLSAGLIKLTNVLLPGKGLTSGPYVSEQELLAMADVAAQDSVIEGSERVLIHSIVEFGDTVVREVMVPRPDMVCVDSSMDVSTALDLALDEGFSRLPVVEDNLDDVVGVVFTKDLMSSFRKGHHDADVASVLRDAAFVPETKRVAELMRDMQALKYHMVIVVDEYGGTAGLATLEDLIEELVGEISDEFDDDEALVTVGDAGDVIVDAGIAASDFNELVGANLPEEEDWDTVAGFVIDALGHLPSTGEVVEHLGFRLVVDRVQGRRVQRVRVSRIDGLPLELSRDHLARTGANQDTEESSG